MTITLGASPLTIERVADVAVHNAPVALGEAAMARIARGRGRLEAVLASGESVYGVNTGVGGNIKFQLTLEQAGQLRHNLIRQLGCASGEAMPRAVVRG